MNRLSGHIKALEVSNQLTLVHITVSDAVSLQAIVIETPATASYLEVGRKIGLIFKETAVVLARAGDLPVSLRNRIEGRITSLETGQLLSMVRMESPVGILQAVISTAAVRELGLSEGDVVWAMIKLNEIMLAE